MKVKQIWMSRDTRKKSRYGLRILGGIAGITALALLSVCGGTVLVFRMGWPAELAFPLLCLGVTALAVAMAAALGRRSVGDATVFFLTEEDRLFAVDVRRLAGHGGAILSPAAAPMEIQRSLREIARSPSLPAGADEILKVEGVREGRSLCALSCQVRRQGRRAVRRTYFLAKDLEDRELLLRQLERREGWDGAPELKEDRKPFYILLSALICCVFVLLCVLSHPAVARLPQSLYFPCLGAAFAALCCVVWLVVRHHRGE